MLLSYHSRDGQHIRSSILQVLLFYARVLCSCWVDFRYTLHRVHDCKIVSFVKHSVFSLALKNGCKETGIRSRFPSGTQKWLYGDGDTNSFFCNDFGLSSPVIQRNHFRRKKVYLYRSTCVVLISSIIFAYYISISASPDVRRTRGGHLGRFFFPLPAPGTRLRVNRQTKSTFSALVDLRGIGR